MGRPDADDDGLRTHVSNQLDAFAICHFGRRRRLVAFYKHGLAAVAAAGYQWATTMRTPRTQTFRLSAWRRRRAVAMTRTLADLLRARGVGMGDKRRHTKQEPAIAVDVLMAIAGGLCQSLPVNSRH